MKWIEALELESEASFWFCCIIIINFRNYKQLFPFSYWFHCIIIVNLRNYKQVSAFSSEAQYFVPASLIYVLNRLKLVVKLSWLIFSLDTWLSIMEHSSKLFQTHEQHKHWSHGILLTGMTCHNANAWHSQLCLYQNIVFKHDSIETAVSFKHIICIEIPMAI